MHRFETVKRLVIRPTGSHDLTCARSSGGAPTLGLDDADAFGQLGEHVGLGPEPGRDLSETLSTLYGYHAITYGWGPTERRRAELLMISLAFGGARFGGCDERFLAPAISAITSVVDAQIATLLETRLVDAPASSDATSCARRCNAVSADSDICGRESPDQGY
jgi:hypothetical protein